MEGIANVFANLNSNIEIHKLSWFKTLIAELTSFKF